MVSTTPLRKRVDPWVLGALALGTFTFLAMPYTLYVMAVLFVYGLAAALVFLFLSPAILTFQYMRYRRRSRLPSLDEG
ncbi:MAG: hypothetical protein ACE5EW_06045 [Thermoplasmata archaeon]